MASLEKAPLSIQQGHRPHRQSCVKFSFFFGTLAHCGPSPSSCRFRPCSVKPSYLAYSSPSCCRCRVAARMEALAVTDRRLCSSCPGGLGPPPWEDKWFYIPSTSCRIGTLLACRTLDDLRSHMAVSQVGGKWKYVFLMGQSDFLPIVETLDFLWRVNRSQDWKDSAEPTCQSCRIRLPWQLLGFICFSWADCNMLLLSVCLCVVSVVTMPIFFMDK